MSERLTAIPIRKVADLAGIVLPGARLMMTAGRDQEVFLVDAGIDGESCASGRIVVVSLSGDTEQHALDTGGWYFHHVQRLSSDEFLLVNGRSSYRGPDDCDLNARIYGSDGMMRSEFLLGDGIESVQVTSDRLIWTSFFDEGVFGSQGWDTRIGASGLVCWDGQGRRLYEYKPPAGLDMICDCYAMNVTTDRDVWICYYTEFPIVHLRDQKVVDTWPCPVSGSKVLVVGRDRVVLDGGYDRRDEYAVCDLKRDSEPRILGWYRLLDEDGEPLTRCSVDYRGDRLWLLSGTSLYTVHASEFAS